MTRVDIYSFAKDRDIITNRKWQSNYRYIRIGFYFYREDLTKINILDESNQNDTDFVIVGKISRFKKVQFVFRLLKQVIEQTLLR